MPEKREFWSTAVFILLLICLMGGLFGGLWLLVRDPTARLRQADLDEPIDNTTYSGFSEPSRETQDQSSQEDSSQDSSQTESQTYAYANDYANSSEAPVGAYNYGGSTTWATLRKLEGALVEASWPDFQLRYTPPVEGHPGSGAGIRMLIEGQLAFSQSSRPIKPEEYEEANQLGFSLVQIPVAIDGIAIAVNPDLDIPGLTIDDLKAIYTGKITDWSEVNGPDLPIKPFSRPPETGGTPEFFVGNVLGNEPFGSTVEWVDDTTQGLRKVAANLGGIYFASSPEVVPQCSTKPIPIARSSSEPFIAPYLEPLVSSNACPEQRNQLNSEVFKQGTYPLTRRLFVVVKKDGSLDQQAGEAYAQLILTDRGQQLVRESGFVSIR